MYKAGLNLVFVLVTLDMYIQNISFLACKFLHLMNFAIYSLLSLEAKFLFKFISDC
jgi:hypothetical protein